MTNKIIKITLIKSISGRLPSHKATITSLGLKKINQSIEVKDNPSMRGMINKIKYLLRIEE